RGSRTGEPLFGISRAWTFSPPWACRRSILEDLAGAHVDRVQPPPVLLPRVLDVRPVHPGVRPILVVPHGEESVLSRGEVRGVGRPHPPVVAGGACSREDNDRGKDHGFPNRCAHGPPPSGLAAFGWRRRSGMRRSRVSGSDC